jgi:glycosyltransferase involved in cell wall biosynthesis
MQSDANVYQESLRAGSRLILMLGPSMDYPGGMTEVIRAYCAAGVFEAWPLRYISTYAGRDFPAKLRPWLSAVCSVLIWLARRRVALIHVHSAAYGSFWRKSVLCAMAYAFRVPYVIHLHDGRLPDFYRRGCNGLAKSWVRVVLRKAARVVVLSRHWRDEVHKIEPAARTTIIGNPVAVPVCVAPLQRPARKVLFLAWLHRDKGVLDLLRAIPIVLRSVPEAMFVIAGSGIAGGEDPESINELARSLGVEQSLRFPGWVDGSQKDDLLRHSDVFVLPSYCEALPLGVLEAMACGVPVVATSVGGIPDVIEDRVNGLLVEPGQPDALARAIVTILTDDALRSRLREAGRSDVGKRFSTASVIKDLGALYWELGIRVHSIKQHALSSAS